MTLKEPIESPMGTTTLAALIDDQMKLKLQAALAQLRKQEAAHALLRKLELAAAGGCPACRTRASDMARELKALLDADK